MNVGIGLRSVMMLLSVVVLGLSWSAPARAQLLQTITCSNGTGTMTLDPPIIATPRSTSAAVEADFPGCSGSGVTGAAAVADIDIGSAVCDSTTGLVTALLVSGTITVYWEGGTGAATTTFSETSPAGLDFGSITSEGKVVLGTGVSTAGRYHGLVPAILVLTTSALDGDIGCPGIAGGTLDGVEINVIKAL